LSSSPPLLLVVLVRALVVRRQGAEEGVPERVVECVEVLEVEPRRAVRGRTRPQWRLGWRGPCSGPEHQRLHQLVHGDVAIAVAVKEVKHVAQAHRVKAAVAEAKS
jgi:hypothetical protein